MDCTVESGGGGVSEEMGGASEGMGGASEGAVPVHRCGQGRTLYHHSPTSTEMTANSTKWWRGFSLYRTQR